MQPTLVILAAGFAFAAFCGPTTVVLQMIGREADALAVSHLRFRESQLRVQRAAQSIVGVGHARLERHRFFVAIDRLLPTLPVAAGPPRGRAWA